MLTLLFIVLLPCCGQPAAPYAIDFSDEAHAIESLRTLYFANRELLNKIIDSLFDVQNYSYLQLSVSSEDDNLYIGACRTIHNIRVWQS